MFKTNKEIKAPVVFLINKDGATLGKINTIEALQMALVDNLDLVEISPGQNPPVCRILDYQKFMYDLKKKNKDKTKVLPLKEIRLRPNIAQGDLNIKIKQVAQFIEKGHKVKITCSLRGRESLHQDVAQAVIQQFIELANAKLDNAPLTTDQNICIILSKK